MTVVFVIVGMLAVGAVSRSGGSDAMVGVMLMLNVVGLFVPIIYSALFSSAGITAFWVVRARRLAATSSSPPEADEDIRPPNE